MKAESILKRFNKQTSLDDLNVERARVAGSNLTDSLTAVWLGITLKGWDETDNPHREIASYCSFRDKEGQAVFL